MTEAFKDSEIDPRLRSMHENSKLALELKKYHPLFKLFDLRAIKELLMDGYIVEYEEKEIIYIERE